ncbi:MAG: energy transducer TonB [bacterium]|nr:energy transducer TonB [bacterium]
MSNIQNALYSPYGAFELKATYWRNLLLSNLAVTLLVGAALVSALVFMQNQPVVEVPPDPPPPTTTVDLDLINPPTIICDRTGPRPAAPDLSGGIPVPVPDEAIDDPDAVVMSLADRAALVEWGVDPGLGEPGAFAVNPDVGEYFPPIDSFFLVEEIPVLIHKVAPEYPHFAEQTGQEGTVWIKALVTRIGTVREAVVIGPSGTPLLDRAALEVADKYLFKPANQNGEPVAVWVTYRVDFVLDD